jgi:hypothetical protein
MRPSLIVLALAGIPALLAGCIVVPPPSDPSAQPGGESAGPPGDGDTASAGDPAAGPETPPTASGTGAGAAPEPPAGPVSVTLINRCRDTVPVFFGADPGYGSGTHSTLSGNSRQSRSMKPGEMFWVTDENRKGRGSATIGSATREIEIDCGGVVGVR